MKTYWFVVACCLCVASAQADPPASSYIFPAGGQRGTSVACRVGGLNLSAECGFFMLGSGVQAPEQIRSMPTLVLVGPYHHNPVAQQNWDYPKDMDASIRIGADAPLGVRYWYCTTSQGATELRPFVVGDLAEVLEREPETRLGYPQRISLPVTINGRVYPRGDLDEYMIAAKAGDTLSCEVMSQRLSHKLDARLELLDASGRMIAECDDHFDADPLLLATIPSDGDYMLRIHDIAFEGDQDYVYRLTLRLGPYVTHIFPAGASAGVTTSVRSYGHGFGPTALLDREITLPIVRGDPIDRIQTPFPPETPIPLDELRDLFAGTCHIDCPFHLGTLPEVMEVESLEHGASPQRVALPAVLNGQLAAPGDVDRFAFTVHKGESFELELFGRRLASPITAVLTVSDGNQHEITRLEGDGRIEFTAVADGELTVGIQDLFRETHGGTNFIYRIVLARSAPDFQATLAQDQVSIQPGENSKVKIAVSRRGGLAADIQVTPESLPQGVTMAPIEVPASASEAELMFSADGTAPVGTIRRVRLVATAEVGDQRLERIVQVPVKHGANLPMVDTLAVSVTHPPLFSIATVEVYGSAPRGATLVQSFVLERQPGFTGDVVISLADRQSRYLQGVTGPAIVCQAGQTQFDYPVFLPEVMDLNRTSRVLVMGTAKVTDANGKTHYVTHATQKQIVCRVCPSLLTLASDTSLLRVRRGIMASIPLRVKRTREVPGELTVEVVLPPEVHGISADSIALGEGQEDVVLDVHVAQDASLAHHERLTFRATGRRDGYPVVAETSVEIELDKGEKDLARESRE